MIYLSPKKIQQLIKEGENIHILDVRENYEYNQCRICTSHIPMGEITNRIKEISIIKNIALLCRSGRRAEAVANLLEQEYKMSDIIVIEGGLINWKEEVDPSLILE